VNVVMDRGCARKALEGVALMARKAARLRRNLCISLDQLLVLEGVDTHMAAVNCGCCMWFKQEWLLIFQT
jgi:hypothetical protein